MRIIQALGIFFCLDAALFAMLCFAAEYIAIPIYAAPMLPVINAFALCCGAAYIGYRRRSIILAESGIYSLICLLLSGKALHWLTGDYFEIEKYLLYAFLMLILAYCLSFWVRSLHDCKQSEN